MKNTYLLKLGYIVLHKADMNEIKNLIDTMHSHIKQGAYHESRSTPARQLNTLGCFSLGTKMTAGQMSKAAASKTKQSTENAKKLAENTIAPKKQKRILEYVPQLIKSLPKPRTVTRNRS